MHVWWGSREQDMAGHDINYLAISGVLSVLPGSADKPTFPSNILADFAGGGLICVLGILLALLERTKSNEGQIVNADMVSGTRYISSMTLLHAMSSFYASRGNNLLDGGAPFYDVYTCSDGRWMSVGCLEPHFFNEFISILIGALPSSFSSEWRPTAKTRFDEEQWPQLRRFLTKAFKTNTRDYWAQVFHGTDSCAVPVLSPMEAAELASGAIPTPHPILTRTRPLPLNQSLSFDSLHLPRGQDTDEILEEFGINRSERRELERNGALGGQRRHREAKL